MSDPNLESIILTCTSNEIATPTTESFNNNSNSNNFVDINARSEDQINNHSINKNTENTNFLNQNQYLNGYISKLSQSSSLSTTITTNTSSSLSSLNNNYSNNNNNNNMNSDEIIITTSTKEESLAKDQNEPQLNQLDKYKNNLEAKQIKVIKFLYV
jgi:hypothetical protein